MCQEGRLSRLGEAIAARDVSELPDSIWLPPGNLRFRVKNDRLPPDDAADLDAVQIVLSHLTSDYVHLFAPREQMDVRVCCHESCLGRRR